MPKRKRTITVSADEEIKIEAVQEEKETVVEKITKKVASLTACGHQNKHYTAGDLYCVLDKGHTEDHLGYIDGKPTAWSDAAGTPVKHA